MEKLTYIFEKEFEADKLELTKRGIKFDVVDDMTIVVANTDSVVLTEFCMKYHMDEKTRIRIMNVDGGCYGHDYNDPITCPKKASQLYHEAQLTPGSWYYSFAG